MYNRDTSDGQKQLILGSISLAVRELAGWSTTPAEPATAQAAPVTASLSHVRSEHMYILDVRLNSIPSTPDIQASGKTYLCIQENDNAGTKAIQESIIRIGRPSLLFPVTRWLVGRHTRSHKVRHGDLSKCNLY